MLDYAWINDLQNALNSNRIFNASVTGAKSFAMAILLFRVLKTFINSTSNDYESPKIGNMMQVIGVGLVLVSSDWIVNLIEQLFSGVNTNVSSMSFNINPVKDYLQALDDAGDTETGLDKIAYYMAVIKAYSAAVVILIIYLILLIFDFAVTCMYLLQRLFLLQLFKFIFPFALALSTAPGYDDLLPRWAKIYMGLFILGIAYTGVLQFSQIVYSTIAPKTQSFTGGINALTSIDSIVVGQLGAIAVMFAVKISLMSFATREIRNFFS